jgi:hypothetical protein
VSVTDIALFCGSREWKDWGRIEEDIARLPKTAVVIHGGQRGADTIAGKLAEQYGLHVGAIHWRPDIYGKAAGPMRNDALMALGPTLAYAYPLPQSRGTWDMVRKLKLANVPVFVADEVLA